MRNAGVKFGRKRKLTPEQIEHARKLLETPESTAVELWLSFFLTWTDPHCIEMECNKSKSHQ